MIKLFILLFLHPFYVSVTTIDLKKDNLEISSRIFYDDLEAALKDEFGGKIDLKNPQNAQKNTEMLRSYFQKNFSLKENGKTMNYDFLGFNLEGEAAWCYIEVKGLKGNGRIDIQNKLLYSQFKEQIHIFHMNAGNRKKSAKITNPDSHLFFDI
jgi:hypothetical protein